MPPAPRACSRIGSAALGARRRGRPRSCRRRAAPAASWTRRPSSRKRPRCSRPCVRAAHRHAGERRGCVPLEADAPVAAVGGAPEHGVDGRRRERAHAVEQQPGGQLRGVHADEQGGSGDILERRRQALAQAGATLPNDLESAAPEVPRVAVEHEHPALRRRPRDDVERVEQRRPRQRGGLGGGARWREPGLGATRNGLLRDHDQRDLCHASNVMPITRRSITKYESRSSAQLVNTRLNAPTSTSDPGSAVSVWVGASSGDRPGQAAARTVSILVLAQSAAGAVAHLGARSRAADRDSDRRAHRVSLQRRLLPAARAPIRSAGRSARSTSTCFRSPPTPAGCTRSPRGYM